MPRRCSLALLPWLLLAPALAAPEPIRLEAAWGRRDPQDIQAALESLAQAKTAGVLNDAELASLKEEMLGTRPAVVSGALQDAPLGDALLAVVSTIKSYRSRLSVVCKQRDLEQLNAVHVSAQLSQADPVEAVRMLLTLAQEEEDSPWEVEYEEPGDGTFLVRVRPREEGKDDDDDDDDGEEGEEHEHGMAPRKPAPEKSAPAQGGVWLGVAVEPTGGPTGLRVTHVQAGSPAEEGGLQVDDVLLSAEGTPLSSLEQLRDILNQLAPGQVVHLYGLRQGTQRAFDVRVAKRP